MHPPILQWRHIDINVLKSPPTPLFLMLFGLTIKTLRWRHNAHDGVSNHQPHDFLPNRLFRRRSKNTSNLRVTGLCVGNSPVTGEFPAQKASNAESVSIWWRRHGQSQESALLALTSWIDRRTVISPYKWVSNCHIMSPSGTTNTICLIAPNEDIEANFRSVSSWRQIEISCLDASRNPVTWNIIHNWLM